MTMGIVRIPQDITLPLTCAVCGVDLALDKATAGLYDCNNRQAFACVSHFMEVEKLILGWADFITTELEKYKTLGDKPAQMLYEQVESDGRSHH